MPLIVLVGHPCSGKTRRARELAAHYTAAGLEVTLVNDEALSLSRKESYLSSEAERRARSALKSALERFLSPSPAKLLIFDYLNSIKGYRYEAWCRAREMQTQTCTVYVNTPVEQCAAWNKERPAEEQYDDKVFVDLCQRMEVPNEEKRWDAPLFTVSDIAAPLPLAAMDEVLLRGKVAPANIGVMPARLESSDYLSELDRVTGAIVQAVLAAQAEGSGSMVGDSLVVPHTKRTVLISRRVHLAELRRIQNAYLKLARVRTPEGVEGIATSFVDQLNMVIKSQGSDQ